MIDDRDSPDPNPYQSPAWSADDERIGDQRGSEMLSEPICVKGSLSLDDVLRAHPGLIRRAWELVLWCFLLSFLALLLGLGSLIIYHRTVDDGLPARTALIVTLGMLSLGLLPLVIALRQFLASYWLRRVWKKQGPVFQYREVTVTDKLITTTSAQEVVATPWTDYRDSRSDRNTVWLYLGHHGLKRRREQRRTEEPQSRFGIHLDEVDTFPRLQFDDDSDWERFQRAVQHRLKK